MSKNQQKVYIIGAGVSGLIAALELEQAGISPVILEKSNRVGGRVKTDAEGGFLFDHGFQVLLTQYPAAKRYLNYDQLNLKTFLPGAVVFQNGNQYAIGDPLRDWSFLWPTLFAPIGTVLDKIKILQLSQRLKKQSISSIFLGPETTTLHFLQSFGFSEKIIRAFFKPFFSGIFLEPNLETSSRMFQFVYKMFSEGHAAIPQYGIKVIPEHLKEKLKSSKIQLNTTVEKVEDQDIITADGTTLTADAIIIATDPANMLSNYTAPHYDWHSCTNFYFKAQSSILKKPIIGLIAEPDALVNNFHYVSDVQSFNGVVLLSATVVKKQTLDDAGLVEKVKEDLNRYCNISDLEFLKKYTISKALPKRADLSYAPKAEDLQFSDTVYLAGDYLSNPSLNAAMEAGRSAARAVMGKN